MAGLFCFSVKALLRQQLSGSLCGLTGLGALLSLIEPLLLLSDLDNQEISIQKEMKAVSCGHGYKGPSEIRGPNGEPDTRSPSVRASQVA